MYLHFDQLNFADFLYSQTATIYYILHERQYLKKHNRDTLIVNIWGRNHVECNFLFIFNFSELHTNSSPHEQKLSRNLILL